MTGTVEQREASREKANYVRLRRAELKRTIKTGRRSLADILKNETPDWLDRMPISQLLESAPRLTRKKRLEWLYTAGVSESRVVEHVTVRQRNLLAELVTEWEERQEELKRARSRRTLTGSRSKRGAP